MKGIGGIFSWLIVGVAVLVVIATIAFVMVGSSESNDRIEKSRRRYLKYERKLKDAHEEAKRLAQLEVEKSIRNQTGRTNRSPRKTRMAMRPKKRNLTIRTNEEQGENT